MADYRIRGYMQYEGVAGGNGGCSDSFIVACASQGRLGLRASPNNLKLLPPAIPVALFRDTLIGCPEAVAAISSDSSGNNEQADGTFKADPVAPTLVPATPFVISAGGNNNSLLLRTLTNQCIYEFVVRASQRVGACCGWFWRKRSSGFIVAALPAPSGQHPPARQPASTQMHCCPAPTCPFTLICAVDRVNQLHPGRDACQVDLSVQRSQLTGRLPRSRTAHRPGSGGGGARAALTGRRPPPLCTESILVSLRCLHMCSLGALCVIHLIWESNGGSKQRFECHWRVTAEALRQGKGVGVMRLHNQNWGRPAMGAEGVAGACIMPQWDRGWVARGRQLPKGAAKRGCLASGALWGRRKEGCCVSEGERYKGKIAQRAEQRWAARQPLLGPLPGHLLGAVCSWMDQGGASASASLCQAAETADAAAAAHHKGWRAAQRAVPPT